MNEFSTRNQKQESPVHHSRQDSLSVVCLLSMYLPTHSSRKWEKSASAGDRQEVSTEGYDGVQRSSESRDACGRSPWEGVPESKFYDNFTTLLQCLYDTVQCPVYTPRHRTWTEVTPARGSRVPALRFAYPPLGEHYADQSCRRDCIPASLSHGGHPVAGRSAGLQSLLARDYPPEFWTGLRRGPSALPWPL
jgi:hypothetical protein